MRSDVSPRQAVWSEREDFMLIKGDKTGAGLKGTLSA